MFLFVTVTMATMAMCTTASLPPSCEINRQDVVETLTLTCHLNQNINVTKRGVSVQYHRSRSSLPKTVFQCSWLQEDEMSCFKYSDDFICLNNRVTDQLMLEIPIPSDRISGTYRCQLVPPEDPSHPADSCALLVTEGTQNTASKSVVSEHGHGGTPAAIWETNKNATGTDVLVGDVPSTIVYPPQQDQATCTSNKVDEVVPAILGAVIFLLVIIIICLCMYHVKQRQKDGWRYAPTTQREPA